MSHTAWAIWAVIILILLYGIVIYNGLVILKNNVKKSFANIDILLVQRHDELPKLIECCRQYMSHEEKTLTEVAQARGQVFQAHSTGDVKSLGTAESALRSGLGSLFAVSENYPNLKADETFQHLTERVSQLENEISQRREFYNESVNINNTRTEEFPSVIIAGIFNFQKATMLEFSSEEKADVNFNAAFKS